MIRRNDEHHFEHIYAYFDYLCELDCKAEVEEFDEYVDSLSVEEANDYYRERADQFGF